MTDQDLKQLKLELAVKAKSGLDFILSATIVWSVIAYIWTLPMEAYNKSIYTFYVGIIMLPLAFLLSKVLKTTWKIKTNPLDPLGLWLNFAQLFYFPFLFFFLGENPTYFVMAYVVITGAHFFPYAWFFDEIGYAFAAGVSSLGAYLIAVNVAPEQMYLVPLFMSGCLALLAVRLVVANRRKGRLESATI